MNLSRVDTAKLRAELNARETRARQEQYARWCAEYPCPECGGDPVEIDQNIVEEFRFAPRDSDGRPMLYAPYELGTTEGGRWETRVTCINGHVTVTDEVKWFDKPWTGPPLVR